MKEFYNTNKDFRDYVDRYCRNKLITPEQALGLFHIRLVAEYYMRLEAENNN